MKLLICLLIFAIIIIVLVIILTIKLIRHESQGEIELNFELLNIFKIHFRHKGKK